jgi:predicted amidophosphoribosyltransferase
VQLARSLINWLQARRSVGGATYLQAVNILEPRSEFLQAFCRKCLQSGAPDGCGLSFSAILAPIRLPDELEGTHAICSFCLALYQRKYRHEETCIFAKTGLHLIAGGWVTPASYEVRQSVRRVSFPYRRPLTNLVRSLLRVAVAENSVIAPIPMSSPGRKDRWLQIATDAAEGIAGARVLPLISRNKQRSARKSVAQERALIAREEYSVDEEIARSIAPRARIIIVDDNVTSGETIVRCAELVRSLDPDTIQPLSVDRALSGRALQRCPPVSKLECSYFAQE